MLPIWLVALIAIGWFALVFWALAIVSSGTRRVQAPPAAPRARHLTEVNLDDVQWDWKRAA